MDDVKGQVTTEAKVTDPVSSPSAEPVDKKPPVSEPAVQGQEGQAEPARSDEKVEPKTESVVPEKYEFKVPEGFTLEAGISDKFTGVAKELKLDNAQAQKLIDLASEHAKLIYDKHSTSLKDGLEKQGQQWLEQIKSDKDFGGSKMNESNEAAIRFRDRFTTPQERQELRALFDSAWGNHPALWRMFVRAGLALGEDKAIDGSAADGRNSPEKVFYPNM